MLRKCSVVSDIQNSGYFFVDQQILLVVSDLEIVTWRLLLIWVMFHQLQSHFQSKACLDFGWLRGKPRLWAAKGLVLPGFPKAGITPEPVLLRHSSAWNLESFRRLFQLEKKPDFEMAVLYSLLFTSCSCTLAEVIFYTAEILFFHFFFPILVAVLSIWLYLQWAVKRHNSDHVGLPEYST